MLTTDEIPAHTHVIPYTVEGGSSAGVGYKLGKSESQSWHQTRTTGGGQAHNNIGPSLAVNIWHKTANGGKVVGQNGGGFSYSTEEQWTGEYWIDGKKIYQKTIVQSITSASSSIDISNLDSETAWLDERSSYIKMVLSNGTTIVSLPVNGFAKDNYSTYAEVIKSATGDTINCIVGSLLLANQLTAYYSLRYTKTTE